MSPADMSGTEPSTGAAASALAAGPNWQEQDPLLRDLWMQNQTPAAIAQALGRSVAAVMTRAARLGLPRRFAPGRKPGRRPAENGNLSRSSLGRTNKAAAVESTETKPQASPRICLMCLTKFDSLGRHNRICSTCKNSAEYESGSRLPDPHFPVE